MTLHEPKCGCCGCKSLNILRQGPLRGSLEQWLNHNRDLNDYEPEQQELPNGSVANLPGHPNDGFGPTKIVSLQSTWENGDFSPQYGSDRAISHGSAAFDLNASTIYVWTSFRPLISRNPTAPFFYPSGAPPEEEEIESSIVLSIYGDTEGTYSIELVGREYPEDFYDNKPIFYDEEKDGNNRINSAPHRAWNAYLVRPNQSAIDTNRGYDGDYVSGYYQNFEEVRAMVTSFNNLPEPEGKRTGVDGAEHTLLALAGTKLSDFKEWKLEGIKDFIVYSESMSLCDFYCGWTACESVSAENSDFYGYPIDPREGGYDGKSLLILGGSQRLVNTPGPARNRVYYGETGVYPYNATFYLTAYAEKNDDRFPGQVACTAYVDRGQPSTWFLGLNITAPARARSTYYRDGEQVFQAINPSPAQVKEATSEEGSYLVVTEALPSLDQNGNRIALFSPRWTKTYSSFVVDKTKPVIGFVPIDDMQGGIDYKSFDDTPLIVLSTEPVSRYQYGSPDTPPDEDASLPIARPAYQSGTSAVAYWSSQYGVGQYPLSLPFGYRDQMNNVPEFQFSQTWAMHPPLQRYREGVKGSIEEPGFQTREHYRPRLQSEPVTQLRLTFSRKIDPSGVSQSQLALFKSTKSGNMEQVEGVSLSAIGDGSREWLITISAEQPERTFFMLTYDASGDVVTDDIDIALFGSESEFPLVGRYKTIYRFPSAGGFANYSWSPSGYVPISGGYPLDPLGIPYTPEPCVLVSRVGWLMADMKGWPRLIDTSSTEPQLPIGRIASVTETMEIDAGNVDSTITASGGLYLPNGEGEVGVFTPGTTFDGFTPGVPSLESPEDDASWWGLTTTIDPAPPALISACAAPKCAQRHASAIRCNGDITELELRLEYVSGVDYSTYKYKLAQSVLGSPFSSSWDFAVLDGAASPGDLSPFTDVAAILVAKEPTALTFIETLEGEQMSQNVWSCVQDGGSASLDVAERCTRVDGYKCGEGDEKWYMIELNAPTRDVSFDDVKDWDVDPDFGHTQITRNGQQVTPEKYMPGDRYGAGAPPSLAGKAIPWWSDRLNPYEREEYEYVRGYGSGIIRKLASGTLEWVKTQGTIAASRSCKQFKGLKTTTLGELVIRVSLRITVKATLHYEDRKNGEQYYGPMISSTGCFDGTWDNTARAIRPGPVFGQILNNDANAYVTGFKWGARIRARGTWEGADQEDSRTITHQFFADLNSGFVLTAEDEEKLANGEELEFPAYFDWQRDGTKSWRWKLKAKVEESEEEPPP